MRANLANPHFASRHLRPARHQFHSRNRPSCSAPMALNTYFPEGNPSTSSSLNAGSVLFSSPGTYVASLTAVDNLGVNDPSPPTRTITVQSPAGTPSYVQANS